jgi:hypothetical protein
MARRTVKAKDLPPETDVALGDSDEEPVAPPGNEHFEVWEGYTYEHGRSWPPRHRVKAWIGKDSAESYARAYTRAEADRAAKKEEPVKKFYVVVRVEMRRSLA